MNKEQGARSKEQGARNKEQGRRDKEQRIGLTVKTDSRKLKDKK